MTLQFPVSDQRASTIRCSLARPTGSPRLRRATESAGRPPAMAARSALRRRSQGRRQRHRPLLADEGRPALGLEVFLRGHNPILYDLGIIFGVDPPDPSAGMPSYESLEPARLAMGDIRRLADRIGLIDMVPVGDLASTGYALANPGVEYVVLPPEGGELTVQLPRAATTLSGSTSRPANGPMGNRYRSTLGRLPSFGHRLGPARASLT